MWDNYTDPGDPDRTCYCTPLAALLKSEQVGIGLRSLVCRQILEMTNERKQDSKDAEKQTKALGPAQIQVLVPALVEVMKGVNVSLASCATAALINLSCGEANTKTLLVQLGVIKLCVAQLKLKDDDLTLYTLFLLINLTKTPHHRSILVREGGVPLLVDVLTSSYQNHVRKQRILCELASVLGQLCNDFETRSQLSDQHPALLCLLWVYDRAKPNTKLKATLLFALKQFCALARNKVKVGPQVIPTVFEELNTATDKNEDGVTNAILLLTMLASVQSNALMMNQPRMDDAEDALQTRIFWPQLKEKWQVLKERVREARVQVN